MKEIYLKMSMQFYTTLVAGEKVALNNFHDNSSFINLCVTSISRFSRSNKVAVSRIRSFFPTKNNFK